ncbi:uncharacterized protein B0I36DRAFT_162856 [Microdochium trichocladiopsis]|uniref:Uncharacterized protein n=1 Tax=Microdochium trichocladiopsis TaxID=1682393 RepID=A0A9P8Y0F5_9PEZI|nr:uncharacterized protein B0I36DRAFT_162856 [Microdochium trichocladiopsis]KAH7024547.1 hypothetical protein B0I36DRAFT_162856 [Microdochium trichocladiopsis]
MCRAHPRRHPCSHTSVHWLYCPRAHFDVRRGRVSGPCNSQTQAAMQSVGTRCTLQHCAFGDLGGGWHCCQCGQGPNSFGWCTAPAPRDSVLADGVWGQQQQDEDWASTATTSTAGGGGGSAGGSSADDDDVSGAAGPSSSSSSGAGVTGWPYAETYPNLCGHMCCASCTPLDGEISATATTTSSSRRSKRSRKDKSGSTRR